MTAIIDKKIVGYKVVTPEEKREKVVAKLLDRPHSLTGVTYKIKSPILDYAIYVVINDITIAGKRVPFEIFIMSKNMLLVEWVTALTRVVSWIFRQAATHEHDLKPLIPELRSVFSAEGGYYKPGGKKVTSVVAEIGDVLEQHLQGIGIIEMAEASPELLEKRSIAKEQNLLPNAKQCGQCGQVAVVRMDNCETCLECGDSKCG